MKLNRSIQSKIALWAGLCLLAASAAIIVYAAFSLRDTAVKSARQQSVSYAEWYAYNIKAELEVPLDSARTLSQALMAVKTMNASEDNRFNRESVNAMLRQVLAENPDFVGVYTLWEPNAFDGLDAQYANTSGHDATGRFIPYWTRDANGNINMEPLAGYDTSDWYQLPKSTKQEQIIDPLVYPVQGEEVLMTSLVVPIVINDQFMGIAGVDVKLSVLQQLADKADIFEKAGILTIVSNNGTLAGVTGQAELIGKSAMEFYDDFFTGNTFDRIQRAEHIDEYHENELEVFVPVQFGRTSTPWAIGVTVADSVVTAQATRLMWQLVGIGALMSVLALVILWLAAGQVSRPIREITAVAGEMAAGDFTRQITIQQVDEVGQLANAFRAMSGNLRDKAAVAEQFAQGNLNVEVPVMSSKDVLGQAMVSMKTSVSGLVSEARQLTKEAVEGKLSVRGEAGKFRGAYAEVVQGINDTLDAVIGPLNVAAEYVDRIAKGDIPQPITDNYNGDFNEIKNNLNTCILAIQLLVDDVAMLSKTALDGQLSVRADVSKHQGDYRQIVQGVNSTLDAVISPLNAAAEYVDRMSRGEIPGQITAQYKGDFDVLKNNLNRLSDRLRDMLSALTTAANNLNTASAEILAATTQQASGATEQSASISQTTTTVQEVKAISEQSSNRAQEVASASQKTVDVSRTGQKAMKDTIESMAQIKEQVESIAENILALSDQTQQIGEIIATVNDIASQSNMLALNASVEAARAGEHGKGFAVVAMEVRSLAEASKQATAQVKAILSEIQKATNTTVMATEEGTKGVEKGVQLAAQARESIEQLGAVINESAQIAVQMMAGGQQQVTGIEQIALAMQNINQVTVQSLASTRQAEKSAQNLNEMARDMLATVNQYRLE